MSGWDRQINRKGDTLADAVEARVSDASESLEDIAAQLKRIADVLETWAEPHKEVVLMRPSVFERLQRAFGGMR